MSISSLYFAPPYACSSFPLCMLHMYSCLLRGTHFHACHYKLCWRACVDATCQFQLPAHLPRFFPSFTADNVSMQEDSSLVVTTLDSPAKVSAMPVVTGDIVYEVATRSCSWYKDMSLDDIMAHLQVCSSIPTTHNVASPRRLNLSQKRS